MKLNNKGVTLIEIIVSITLISIVLVFLLQLLITLKEMDDKSLSKLEYEEKTSLIIKNIQDYIKDEQKCEFSNANANQLTIKCENNEVTLTRNNQTLTLETTSDKTKTWTFPDKANISDINIKTTTKNNLIIATLNIEDEKNNIYPIEISYLSK